MKKVYLSIGSNLGNREKNITTALKELEKAGCIIEKLSPVYETEPWGFETKNWFLNIAAQCKTNYKPFQLLELIEKIEKKLGRIHKSQNNNYSSRTIDIDILFYEDYIISTPKLKIPHPKLHQRLFVLKPMNDICSQLIHPLLKQPIWKLLKYCPDTSKIKLFAPKLELIENS